LRKASGLALDAVVLGSVKATPTHPGALPLGWTAFEQLISGYALPVYGIGGMRAMDVPEALAAGAQGVAMMRGW
jgi:8-oxo-dGTP diphosphatase